MNNSTSLSPFEIVHGYRPTKPLDLVPLSPHVRVSESAETFAQHIHDLHHDILKTLHDNYHQYTLHADLHERFKEFNVGDHVMVRIKLECLPSGFAHKLQAHSASPFKVIKCIGSNTYLLNLPPNYATSFNIENLTTYYPPLPIPESLTDESPLPPIHSSTHELILCPSILLDKIDSILEDQIVSMQDNGVHSYHWMGRLASDDTWLTREEL